MIVQRRRIRRRFQPLRHQVHRLQRREERAAAETVGRREGADGGDTAGERSVGQSHAFGRRRKSKKLERRRRRQQRRSLPPLSLPSSEAIFSVIMLMIDRLPSPSRLQTPGRYEATAPADAATGGDARRSCRGRPCRGWGWILVVWNPLGSCLDKNPEDERDKYSSSKPRSFVVYMHRTRVFFLSHVQVQNYKSRLLGLLVQIANVLRLGLGVRPNKTRISLQYSGQIFQ